MQRQINHSDFRAQEFLVPGKEGFAFHAEAYPGIRRTSGFEIRRRAGPKDPSAAVMGDEWDDGSGGLICPSACNPTFEDRPEG
mgnify:CR=1 FL=1